MLLTVNRWVYPCHHWGREATTIYFNFWAISGFDQDCITVFIRGKLKQKHLQFLGRQRATEEWFCFVWMAVRKKRPDENVYNVFWFFVKVIRYFLKLFHEFFCTSIPAETSRYRLNDLFHDSSRSTIKKRMIEAFKLWNTGQWSWSNLTFPTLLVNDSLENNYFTKSLQKSLKCFPLTVNHLTASTHAAHLSH